MFDVFGRKEKKQEQVMIAAEKRQAGYIHDQQVMSAGINPDEDQSYRIEQELRSDLIRWQQDLGRELFQLIVDLKGYTLDDNDNIVKTGSKPLCNDLFIKQIIIPQIRPFLSKNLINSNLDEHRILDLLKSTMNEIVDGMADGWLVNKSKYEIQFTDHDLVIRLIKNAIIPAPFRALKGWTKKIDSASVRRIEAFSDRPQKEEDKGKFPWKWG